MLYKYTLPTLQFCRKSSDGQYWVETWKREKQEHKK